MKRQTKKQWCEDWITSWGCNNPVVIRNFYHYLGGRGKRPDMLDTTVHQEMVNKTIEFKELINPYFWTMKHHHINDL